VVFAKQLRERIRRGKITRTVRIWQRCHVKVAGRYRMGDGQVVVTAWISRRIFWSQTSPPRSSLWSNLASSPPS
jgi:hypothetical protein